MKICFEGPIKVITQDENGENGKEITSPEVLKKLDKIKYESVLSDYLFDGEGNENLKKLYISGGTLGLVLNKGCIYMVMEYISEIKPNADQLQTLWKYTEEQLSDGAGPIFSGECEDKIGLCPLFESNNVSVSITEKPSLFDKLINKISKFIGI